MVQVSNPYLNFGKELKTDHPKNIYDISGNLLRSCIVSIILFGKNYYMINIIIKHLFIIYTVKEQIIVLKNITKLFCILHKNIKWFYNNNSINPLILKYVR